MNVNVLNRETLEDAMEHPENYPQLTIRVSGYAVNFVRLTREQQLDVLSRTFHGGRLTADRPCRAAVACRTMPDHHAGHAAASAARPATLERTARLAAVRAGELGSVHSWELVTAVDGPGTRLTYFLSGCALRCLYCQNPDTWRLPDGIPTHARRGDRPDRPLRAGAQGHRTAA